MGNALGGGDDQESVPSETAASHRRGSRKIGEIDRRLQVRLSRGVDVNVKVVVRGARGTGKSTLLSRLEGKEPEGFGFEKHYVPTREIAVTHVHWRNRTDERVVKVEAWDVVDEAIDAKAAASRVIPGNVDMDALAGLPSASFEERLNEVRRRSSSSQTAKQQQRSEQASSTTLLLDSTLVDVYKNAHACFLLYDPRRRSTLEYIVKLAVKAPQALPIVFVRSFYDECELLVAREQNSPDFVSKAEALQIVKTELGIGASTDRSLYWLDTSARSKHGLRKLYKYLTIPYLYALKMQLKAQLDACEQNLATALVNMDKEESQGETSMITRQTTSSSSSYHYKPENPKPLSPQQNGKDLVATASLGKEVLGSWPNQKQQQGLEGKVPVDTHVDVQLEIKPDQKQLDAFFADVDSDDERQQRVKSRSIVESCLIEPKPEKVTQRNVSTFQSDAVAETLAAALETAKAQQTQISNDLMDKRDSSIMKKNKKAKKKKSKRQSLTHASISQRQNSNESLEDFLS